MKISISKVRLVKSIGGLIANSCWSCHFYFLSFFINQSLWLFEKVIFKIPNEYDRQKTSELPYKHDIDIFINETCKNSSLWWTLWQIVQRMTITKICPVLFIELFTNRHVSAIKKINQSVFLFQLLQFDYEIWEIIIHFITCFSFWRLYYSLPTFCTTTGHSINTGPYGEIQKYILFWSYCTDWT
jgi:hypothetical protein